MSVPAHQLTIVKQLGIPIDNQSLPSLQADVIQDGVIGYSLQGNPKGRAADLIRWANLQSAPTLALDTRSGSDTAAGETFEPSISAAATFTLAQPKSGLFSSAGSRHIGELYLGDICVPPSLYAPMRLRITSTFFQRATSFALFECGLASSLNLP
ncbi:NAD(P)H-hydrate epimerase [Neorhodopirellula lusitana]|uniref:NAD(P)H-hydrate epimerase n=1 Tax=Neorhodopirellula lusitana TaxID=445327 RepID=UPI00384F8EDA